MSTWTDMLREKARAALPPIEGEIHLSGLRERAEVVRDRWGVPHIYAGSIRDLFLAAGFVVASDRLFQQDLTMRLANGRLAELVGEPALAMDRFVRTVGLHRAARRIVAGYDDLSHEIVQASLAGTNAWIEHMPARPVEYEVLGLDPEPFPQGEEGEAYGTALAVFMSWALSTNWDLELLRVDLAERIGWEGMATLMPDLSTEPAVLPPGTDEERRGRRSALDLLRHAPRFPQGQGSNNWVVSGRRTFSGKPLLANDPHLFAQMPSIWYEIHLSAPGFEVSGVTIPLVAGVQIGHTPHHAWGLTNVRGDTQDLYLERLSDDRTAALYRGAWEPVRLHREEITVRGRDDREVVEVMETRHGPILDSYLIGMTRPEVVQGGIRETYALRWTGLEQSVAPSTLYRMVTASSFDAFREALREWHCPGQNVVYADVEGNIAYQCTGRYPIRAKGDGTMPVPGWSGEHEWDGWLPFEELPWSLNPAEGFLVTANHRIHDATYPHLIGKDFLPPFRARRITELIASAAKHDLDSFRRIHLDTVSIPARETVPLLLRLEPTGERQTEALAMLSEWDFDLAAPSAPAALYEVWCRHIAETVLRPLLGDPLFVHYFARREWSNVFQLHVLPAILANPADGPFGWEGEPDRDDALRRALDGALDELTTAMGGDMRAWRWGTLHRVRLVGPLGIVPDLAELFFGGEMEAGGDEQTVCQGMFEPSGASYDVAVLPSWRQVIDLADVDRSMGTHTTGQSGNPASPHYRDLFPLWATGQYHPLPLSRPAVEAVAEATLELTPG